MPDDDRKIDIRHFVLLKNRGLRGCNGLGSARVSRAGDGVVAIANVRKMGLTGLEPVTLRLSSACSNQLSYRPQAAATRPNFRFSISD